MPKYYKDRPWEYGPREEVPYKDNDHLDYIERSNPNENQSPRQNYYDTRRDELKTKLKPIIWATVAVICFVLLVFHFV